MLETTRIIAYCITVAPPPPDTLHGKEAAKAALHFTDEISWHLLHPQSRGLISSSGSLSATNLKVFCLKCFQRSAESCSHSLKSLPKTRVLLQPGGLLDFLAKSRCSLPRVWQACRWPRHSLHAFRQITKSVLLTDQRTWRWLLTVGPHEKFG